MSFDRSLPPPPAAVRPFRFGRWESPRLEGGPRIMVLREPGVPLVHLEIVLGIGADRDPVDRRGLTALGAGLLDEGTAGLDALAIAGTVEQLGASLETAADWDGVYVAISSLSEHLPALLELGAEIALRPSLPAGELERLRRLRLAELAHRASQPDFVAGVHAVGLVYGPDHPYGASLLGTAEGVAAIDAGEVRAWHAARARPELTTLVAVGDTSAEEIVALAREHFAGWPGGAAALPPRPPEPPAAPSRRVLVVDRPGADQTELRIARIGPARGAPEYLAARLANLLLGGKFTSRLNLNLRERLGITYGVHSTLGGRRGRGPFSVSCALDTEAAGRGVGEILAEMDRMASAPPPAEELEDGKSYLTGTFPYRLQSLDGLADHLATVAIYDRPDDYFDSLPGRIASLTAEDVARSAADLLRTDDLAIVAVGPAARLARQLEPFGALEVRSDPASPSS
ncbi:MAG: insulinase family protein [Acidobacteriota bacterium]|nr:insulinase family protein [Acidobacteriota bacterium]MDH3522696.1 insulinase family protein [Acidobacteriota bacterium]